MWEEKKMMWVSICPLPLEKLALYDLMHKELEPCDILTEITLLYSLRLPWFVTLGIKKARINVERSDEHELMSFVNTLWRKIERTET